MRPHRLLTLVPVALLAMLAGPPAASGDTMIRMGPAGLSVVTEESSRAEEFLLFGQDNPFGTVRSWRVAGQHCGTPDFACVKTDDPSDCEDDGGTFPGSMTCQRRAPGLTFVLLGGNDRLSISRTYTDAVTIDAGDGDDVVGANFPPQDLAEPATAPTGIWTASLGTGDDKYQGSSGSDRFVTGGDGEDEIDTYAGNDVTINGGAGHDDIDPGAGNDSVIGGTGNDFMRAGDESQRADGDSYDGSGGTDTLDWSQRTTGVTVVLVAGAGGSNAENDGVIAIERMIGGSGPDSFLGYSSDGRGGDDVLTGDNGANIIRGGSGSDVIRGFGGDDLLIADDDGVTRSGAVVGTPDVRITCSTGVDQVFLDLTDPAPEDQANCEQISRRAIEEEAATVIRSAAATVRGSRATIRMQCPRAVGRACAGSLRLALGRRSGGPATRYRIAAGRTRMVKAALSAAQATLVRRTAKALTATATSLEDGRKGPETVSRQIKLR
jgi:hypothetical protein